MRMPNPGTSPRRLVHFFGLYLLARLIALAQTVSIAAPWRRVLDALKAAIGVSDTASERQVMARAALDVGDLALDDQVRTVAAAARIDLGGRAEGPDWSRLFHVPPGEVVRLPIDREVEEVKRIEAELASNPTWTTARSHVQPLASARQGLERAHADYRAAVEASDTADRRLADAVTAWELEYRAVFGRLTALFPGKRSFVDGFFWQPEEPSKETPPAPSTNVA